MKLKKGHILKKGAIIRAEILSDEDKILIEKTKQEIIEMLERTKLDPETLKIIITI